MKRLLFLPMLLFFGSISSAQDLDGSWKLVMENEEPVEDLEVVRIYEDDYFAFGAKDLETNEFRYAGGGEYSFEEGYSEAYDFYTSDTSLVGEKRNFQDKLNDDLLVLTDTEGNSQTWELISKNKNDLSGNWVITGRKRDGEISRSTPGARRTIKILGGDRFQWVAFNSDTAEFSGSGGGTYSAEDGKYVENIDFFSRDASRVGAKLPFDYEVKDGEWHHSGKSSKGDPFYEIWSPYAEAYTGD